MRVLHVVPSYLPAVRYGGPIYSVHRLCVALAHQGHHVDVVTTNVDGDGDSAVPLGARVNLDGVGVHYFPSRMLRRLYYAPLMRTWLRRHVATYDVVHLHSVFLWPTLAASRAATRNAVPYVLSPRGMLVNELVRARSRWLKTAWIELFERRTVACAAAIHLTSRIERLAFDDFEISTRAMLEVIPNGVDASEAVVDSSDVQPPYVLMLGRISWKKRIERAIDAIAAVPGIRLVIAGGDDENLLPSLQNRAQNLGVGDRVGFTGRVDGERKCSLIRGARALVMVSMTENYGNVVLEAMALGTPAIVVPQVGAAEAVRAADAGWVIEDSVAALQSQLQKLLMEPEVARESGRRGAQWVRSHASWPAIASRMAGLYQRIAQGRASR